MAKNDSKEKKLNWKWIIPSVLGILGLFALAAWFRSYITHQQYLDNLYFLLAGATKEFWKFISTPTLFITVVILLIAYIYREKVLAALSHLKRVEVGSTKAEFELGKLIESMEGRETSSGPNQFSKELIDTFPVTYLIENLEIDWIRFLLRNERIIIDMDKGIKEGVFDSLILDPLKEGLHKSDKIDDATFMSTSTAFFTLFRCLDGIVLRILQTEGLTIGFELLSGIRELLQNRLNDLEKKEGKESKKTKKEKSQE